MRKNTNHKERKTLGLTKKLYQMMFKNFQENLSDNDLRHGSDKTSEIDVKEEPLDYEENPFPGVGIGMSRLPHLLKRRK